MYRTSGWDRGMGKQGHAPGTCASLDPTPKQLHTPEAYLDYVNISESILCVMF